MSEMKLTNKQIALLEYAREQTDTANGMLIDGAVEVALCGCMAINGLLSETLPHVFVITPAGREWLVESTKERKSCVMVKLTESQESTLRFMAVAMANAKWYGAATKETEENANVLVEHGLADAVPTLGAVPRYSITSAGREWLAEKKQDAKKH